MNDNPLTLISRRHTTKMFAIVTQRCLKADIQKFGLTRGITNKVQTKFVVSKKNIVEDKWRGETN